MPANLCWLFFCKKSMWEKPVEKTRPEGEGFYIGVTKGVVCNIFGVYIYIYTYVCIRTYIHTCIYPKTLHHDISDICHIV